MRVSLLALSLLFVPGVAHAAIVDVASADALIAAINGAKAGDEIVLADGVYAIKQNLSCSASGTAAAPIVVRAASPLKAQITFDAVEGFKVSGQRWRFEGLLIRGVCASDSDCEHAFHVTGNADDFTLRGCTVRDFNAQLKVNAAQDGSGTWQTPDRGLIEGCDLGDDKPRQTSNPVTKLNIDTGDDWVVRANFIHDFRKDGGDGVSYAAFMKSGGNRGTFERNLVLCRYNDKSGGTRLGLSFGGGGTGAQFCAPAYDASVPCSVEHSDGVMRNNLIASCDDVGIYLNRAKNTHLIANTVVGTAGIDFRFETTSGEADGNVVEGKIRNRDGATHEEKTNLTEVSSADVSAWYTAPLAGDFSLKGNVSALLGKGPQRPDLTDDYCLRQRPAGPSTLGALEHSLGDCDTFPPTSGSSGAAGSGGSGAGAAGSGQAGSGQAGSAQAGGSQAGAGQGQGGSAQAGSGQAGGSQAGQAGASAGQGGSAGGSSGSSGQSAGGQAGGPAAPADDDGGCGCRTAPGRGGVAGWVALAALVAWGRRRRAAGRYPG